MSANNQENRPSSPHRFFRWLDTWRPKIFIAYVREDRSKLSKSVDVLRRNGIRVWWDKDIPGGERWKYQIRKHIPTSDAIVPAFSASYKAKQSSYVDHEVALAAQSHRDTGRPRTCLPVTLAGGSVPTLAWGAAGETLHALQWRKVKAENEFGETDIVEDMERTFAWKRNTVTLSREWKSALTLVIVALAVIPVVLWDEKAWRLWGPSATWLSVIASGLIVAGGLYFVVGHAREDSSHQIGGWPYLWCLVFNMGWFLASTYQTADEALVSQHATHLRAQALLFCAAIAVVVRRGQRGERLTVRVIRIDAIPFGLLSWVVSFLCALMANLLALLDSQYQAVHNPEVTEELRRQWVYGNNTIAVWLYLVGAVIVLWFGRLRVVSIGAFLVSFTIFVYLVITGRA